MLKAKSSGITRKLAEQFFDILVVMLLFTAHGGTIYPTVSYLLKYKINTNLYLEMRGELSNWSCISERLTASNINLKGNK